MEEEEVMETPAILEEVTTSTMEEATTATMDEATAATQEEVIHIIVGCMVPPKTHWTSVKTVPTKQQDINTGQLWIGNWEVAKMDAEKEGREIVTANNIKVNNLPPTYLSVAQRYITAHLDTGATGTYIMVANITAKDAPALLLGCTNGIIMTSTKATHLAIPTVPKAANQARVFDELKRGNLLLIRQAHRQPLCSFFPH